MVWEYVAAPEKPDKTTRAAALALLEAEYISFSRPDV
jgi:hypothetical protein